MKERLFAGACAADAPPAERLAALFDVHAARLYRLARRLVFQADDALDLVQETFLRAARAPESIPSGAAVEEAWLVRVLVNVRRDQWRKEAVRRRHEKISGAAPLACDGHEEAVLARTIVWAALDLLPPRRRAIVVMHELEGLTVAAVAALLGISAITVRWHLALGRRELGRLLGPEHVGDTDARHQKPAPGHRPAAS